MPSNFPCHQLSNKYAVILVLYHVPDHNDDKIWAALLYEFFEEEEFDSPAKGENGINTMISESKSADYSKQRKNSGIEQLCSCTAANSCTPKCWHMTYDSILNPNQLEPNVKNSVPTM
jgi:hypothetical protein